MVRNFFDNFHLLAKMVAGKLSVPDNVPPVFLQCLLSAMEGGDDKLIPLMPDIKNYGLAILEQHSIEENLPNCELAVCLLITTVDSSGRVMNGAEFTKHHFIAEEGSSGTVFYSRGLRRVASKLHPMNKC